MILNRNLPEVSNSLVEHLKKWNGDISDYYVIESGSDEDKLSKYHSFWANWPEALEKGLRYGRGFNYGLLELDKTGKRYDYYFLVTGDSEFPEQPTLKILYEVMQEHSKIGIISPLSPTWGEAKYFSQDEDLKCVWALPHVSWLMRRELLDTLITRKNQSYMNYIYDGTNFRGYDADSELIIKGYQNDFATAVTSRASFRENSDLTDQNAEVMKTERREIHQRLMYEEGLAWMKKKYGFASKLEMRDWAVREYQEFMKRNPEYQRFTIWVKVRGWVDKLVDKLAA